MQVLSPKIDWNRGRRLAKISITWRQTVEISVSQRQLDAVSCFSTVAEILSTIFLYTYLPYKSFEPTFFSFAVISGRAYRKIINGIPVR